WRSRPDRPRLRLGLPARTAKASGSRLYAFDHVAGELSYGGDFGDAGLFGVRLWHADHKSAREQAHGDRSARYPGVRGRLSRPDLAGESLPTAPVSEGRTSTSGDLHYSHRVVW